jgi:type IV secretory pathway TrbF-like protein
MTMTTVEVAEPRGEDHGAPDTERASLPPVRDFLCPPMGYEYGEARQSYVQPYAAALVVNRYLKIALLCLAVVAVGLVAVNLRTLQTFRNFKPLVIRIDEVGRAAAVDYAALAYTPQAPELKYFLVQFVTMHYSRMRATVRQQYAESLYFLDGRLADATIDANKKSGTIERFLTNNSEEIEVRVKNVTLDDLRQPPYRATVEFEEVSLAAATRLELKRETYVAHLVFVLRDHVENARIPINPLGLTITYFREDQAFVNETGHPTS